MTRLLLLVVTLFLLLSFATAKKCTKENIRKLTEFKIEPSCKTEKGKKGFTSAPGKTVSVVVSLKDNGPFVPETMEFSLSNVKQLKIRCLLEDKKKHDIVVKDVSKKHVLKFKDLSKPVKKIIIVAKAEDKKKSVVIKIKNMGACSSAEQCVKKGEVEFEDFVTTLKPSPSSGGGGGGGGGSGGGGGCFRSKNSKYMKLTMKLKKGNGFLIQKMSLVLKNIKGLKVMGVSTRKGNFVVEEKNPGETYTMPVEKFATSVKEVVIIGTLKKKKEEAEIKVKKLEACKVADKKKKDDDDDDDSEEQLMQGED